MTRRRSFSKDTERWRPILLEALTAGATLTAASQTAGVGPATVYYQLRCDAAFAKALDKAAGGPRKRGPKADTSWHAAFLQAVAAGAAARQACAAVGIRSDRLYDHLRVYEEFAARYEDAKRQRRNRSHASRWRNGERDSLARRGHNAELRQWRRSVAGAAFTPAVERALLASLRDGADVAEASPAAGLTVQAVFGRAVWDQGWRSRLDASLTAGRDPGISHGTSHSYKKHRCRCPECRAANDRSRGQRRGVGTVEAHAN